MPEGTIALALIGWILSLLELSVKWKYCQSAEAISPNIPTDPFLVRVFFIFPDFSPMRRKKIESHIIFI